MANEVPESAMRERPVLRAGREPSPEELHGTIGPARNPLVPPAGSVEAHLDAAAREALSSASYEGALGAAVGLMTYGRSAARLGRAAAMRRSLARNPNYPRHELLRRTGYQRGLFGMGVETHGDASLKPMALFQTRRVNGRLGDLAYVNREVEIAYPGMRDVPVRIVPDVEWADHVAAAARGRPELAMRGRTETGFLVPNGGGISIRGRMPGEGLSEYLSRADSTLVHEMQHIAQNADGIRAPYPHPTREAYLRDAREVDARNSADRRVLSGDERTAFLRTATQDTAPELVNLDDKGGDNFGSFRNFLATDDVPESIFGFPVVQREEDYTESDLKFFKENPKAAGFYDMGDDEMDEEVPQQGFGTGIPGMLAVAAGLVGVKTAGDAESKLREGFDQFKKANGSRVLNDTTVTDSVSRELLAKTGWQFGYAPGEVATEVGDPDLRVEGSVLIDVLRSEGARDAQELSRLHKIMRPTPAQVRRMVALEKRSSASEADIDRATAALLKQNRSYRVSDVLDLDSGAGARLARMYPDLRSLPFAVKRAPKEAHGSGYFSPREGIVVYDDTVRTVARNPSLLRGLLVHEVQHFIQDREKWASGSDVTDPNYKRVFGEIGSYNAQRRVDNKAGLLWDTVKDVKPSQGVYRTTNVRRQRNAK